MFLSTKTKFPTPDAATAPQTMTFPPPCSPVEMRCLGFIALLALLQSLAFLLHPKMLYLDSSVNTTCLQKSRSLSIYL